MYTEGQRVEAVKRITEGGGKGHEDAKFPSPKYIHAEKGDFGSIERVMSDSDGTVLTVRFDKGTATDVGPEDIKIDDAHEQMYKDMVETLGSEEKVLKFIKKTLMPSKQWSKRSGRKWISIIQELTQDISICESRLDTLRSKLEYAEVNLRTHGLLEEVEGYIIKRYTGSSDTGEVMRDIAAGLESKYAIDFCDDDEEE